MKKLFISIFALCSLYEPMKVFADSGELAISHAPIGIMGDHYHNKGEWMFSARYVRMSMADNLIGSRKVTEAEIIENPNPYQSGMMSTKLSIVPEKMEMDMAMLGLMHAPSDSITLMSMAMFEQKEMQSLTYKGVMPNMGGMSMPTMGGMDMPSKRTSLGSFKTESSDLKSLSISALIKLFEREQFRAHVQLGIEKNFNSNDETGDVLTPMNTRAEMVLPYAMQIGDGSTSLLSAFTFVNNKRNDWVFGFQGRARTNLQKDAWAFGNSRTLNAWVQKSVAQKTSVSAGISYSDISGITGRDPRINGPVQAANPSNYGGTTTSFSLGLNQLVKIFPGSHDDRIGLEISKPINQNLNGPQMGTNWQFQIGYQKSFGY